VAKDDTTTVTEIHLDDETVVANGGSVDLGSSLHDKATVTDGGKGTPTGDVEFTFFTGGNCTTGTPVAAGTVALDGSGVAHPSASTGSLGAGSYAFQAHYVGDDNYNGSTSDCEPFSIGKASPGITTTPNPTSGNVGVTLNDSATLSNGFNPTGSITFKLYDPDQSSCLGTPRYTQTVTVIGNGIYTTSPGFVTDKAGTWRWTADYSGDGNNNPTSSGCNDEQVVIENPVVSKITPTQTTCQQFKDGTAATLSQLDYSVKNGKINQVSPGVFFYWIKVTAIAGSNTFHIVQDTPGATNTFDNFFAVAAGSKVFDSNCVAVSPAATITQTSLSTAPNTTTITFNASSGAGTYFIGIKYDSGSVKGLAAPTYDPVSYSFTTTEAGASSTQGLLLKKKF
jgi:hypothetical protein